MSDWQLPWHRYEGGPEDLRSLIKGWSYGPELVGLNPTLAAARGEGVVCCVLDTASDTVHRELPSRVDSRIFTGESSGVDKNGHSTHVAGTIHEWAEGADLALYKVLKDSGSGSTTGIANAIKYVTHRWVTDWRDKKYVFCLVNMSLGGSYSADIDNAMREGVAEGVLYFCAAGNSGASGVDHPGNSKFSAATVAAIDQNLNAASFSSRGPQVTVALPGVGIVSTWPNNQFRSLSGTSMATPACCGLAAVWLSSMPTRKDLRDYRNFQVALHGACRDLGVPGRDNTFGAGLPIPDKLVDMRPWRLF